MFDRCSVINLARRPERWEQFCAGLPNPWPLALPERFDAIDGHAADISSEYLAKPGAWGAWQSHLAVWRTAIEDGIDSVLVFEDDAIFDTDFSAKWMRFCADVPDDWDMVYLGGQHLGTHKHDRQPERVSDYVVRCRNVNRMHAYAIRGEFMLFAYKELSQFPPVAVASLHHIDHRLGTLHSEHHIYAPAKWLVGQRSGVSDISDKPFQELWWNSFPVREAVAC